MNKNFSYKDYLSPFTYRYGSREMREIFSEYNKILMYRKMWTALAKAQKDLGLISVKEYNDIAKNVKNIDIEKSQKLEKELHHDIASELKVFASQCRHGGGKLHLGATSADITDNADVLRIKSAFVILEKKLKDLLKELAKFIKKHKDLTCIAFTHLQPAEPTTFGYRFCLYAQDLLADLEMVRWMIKNLKGKGFKGAVGTSASFLALFDGNPAKVRLMEDKISRELGFDSFEIASQVYPRKQDYSVTFILSSLAQSLHKMAFDLRIMQSPGVGEIYESFGKKQVGSSAMPFKKNPIISERICSIARFVKSLPAVAWDNAANSLLERTLDDSANRRIILPQAFLSADEILELAIKLIKGLEVNSDKIKKNFEIYGPFSGIEPLMMAMVKKGIRRHEVHEKLRKLSLRAWEEVKKGNRNQLIYFVQKDGYFSKHFSEEKIGEFLSVHKYSGTASKSCKKILKRISKL